MVSFGRYIVLWRPDDDKSTGLDECYKFIKLVCLCCSPTPRTPTHPAPCFDTAKNGQ